MNKIMVVQNSEMQIREYNGQRVVTFKDIDTVHQRPSGTARKAFNRNKKRLIQGEDYFVQNTDEAKSMYGIIAPNGLTVVTESGYLMIVKSFDDDLAWKVQRQLVNGYFRASSANLCEISTGRESVLPLASDNWYLRNQARIAYICKVYDATHRDLYHFVLRQLSKTYDVEGAKLLYEQETGRPLPYSIEVVNYFKALGKEADKILDRLELQILKKD